MGLARGDDQLDVVLSDKVPYFLGTPSSMRVDMKRLRRSKSAYPSTLECVTWRRVPFASPPPQGWDFHRFEAESKGLLPREAQALTVLSSDGT